MKDNTNTLMGCISTKPCQMNITENNTTVKVILIIEQRQMKEQYNTLLR